MKETYLEYNFSVQPKQPATDILVAELEALGFEGFQETSEGLLAYIPKEAWKTKDIEQVRILDQPDFKISYEHSEIEQENWNARWEANFEPIILGHHCAVRAPFHQKPDVKYDIVIAPKMSFGTGHHETTRMMLQLVLKNNMVAKAVLDMGCGTGVLAILSALKGAAQIDAVDFDHLSFLNALENVRLNGQEHIRVIEGNVDSLGDQTYDIIMANINRNTLLSDIPSYVKHLNKGGILLLSGFYKSDLPDISEKCAASGLSFQENLEINDWVSAKYVF